LTFTCATTNVKGYIVSGSTNGTLRLYSGVPGMTKDQNTVFPKKSQTNFQLDECIQGIDVTSDDRYILATGTSTIFIVDTIVGNKSAFENKLGEMKPDPIQLKLKSEDAKKIGMVNFSVAKFDNDENWIITTTGNFVISWSFKNVLVGDFIYQIIDMKGSILDKQFTEQESKSKDASIVVMTESKIYSTALQQ
jgi:hypothetical protein